MFKRILVYAPLEDEELLALNEASELALRHDASIRVVRVLQEGAWWNRVAIHGQGPRLRTLLEESQRQVLQSAVEPLRESGIEIEVEIRWGTPWYELVQLVLEHDHDLVMKTAEGAARGSGLHFGSTAMHLIRKCPCPVWVVGRRNDPGVQRVVAAVDHQTDDLVRRRTAERVLNLATGVAHHAGAELHVATAWYAPGESLFAGRLSDGELARWAEAARNEAQLGVEYVLARTQPPPKAEIHLLRGEPRDVLPGLVEKGEFDLLVMGTHGRVGIAGFLIGETAETLIRTVRCSVLVVKPPHFVCPVAPAARAA